MSISDLWTILLFMSQPLVFVTVFYTLRTLSVWMQVSTGVFLFWDISNFKLHYSCAGWLSSPWDLFPSTWILGRMLQYPLVHGSWELNLGSPI